MLKRIAALLAALITMAGIATPAEAATATRPVTLTVVSSTCVQYQWVLTLAATSTTLRTVDVYDDTDYGNRVVTDLGGVDQVAVLLSPGKTYTVSYHPGASVQDDTVGLFKPGLGGWDGPSDPLARAHTWAPHLLYPGMTC